MSTIELKKNETVLSFNHNNKDIDLKLKELKKNLLVLGATGTGKTTTIIKPCIESLIKTNSFGLIFDLKGNLFADVLHLAKKHGREKDVLLLGTYDFCEPINLLKSIENEEQLKKILNRMIPEYEGDKNKIWRELGVNDISNVFTMYNAYKRIKSIKEDLTLKLLLEMITNKEVINEIYETIKNKLEDLTGKELIVYKESTTNSFSLLKTLNTEDIGSKEQESWRSGVIRQLFSGKSENIINNFYEKGDLNLKELLFKENKIIVICAKPEEYFSIIEECSYIRKLFMEAVTSLNKYERKQLKIGEDFNRYSFLLIDEYQGFVDFETNKDINDELWLSISREYENINIFSTQSISSILSQAGRFYQATSLLQNFVNKIIFSNLDNETIREHYIFPEAGLFMKKLNLGECIIQISENGNVKNYERVKLDSNNFTKKEYQVIIEEELIKVNNIRKKDKEVKLGRYITNKYLNKIEFDNQYLIEREDLIKSEEYQKIYKLMNSFKLYSLDFIEKFMVEINNIDFQNIENEMNDVINIVNRYKETLSYQYKDLIEKKYNIVEDFYTRESICLFLSDKNDLKNYKTNNISKISKIYNEEYVVETNLINHIKLDFKLKNLFFILKNNNIDVKEILKLIKIKKENNALDINYYTLEEDVYNKISLITINKEEHVKGKLNCIINEGYLKIPYMYLDKIISKEKIEEILNKKKSLNTIFNDKEEKLINDIIKSKNLKEMIENIRETNEVAEVDKQEEKNIEDDLSIPEMDLCIDSVDKLK